MEMHSHNHGGRKAHGCKFHKMECSFWGMKITAKRRRDNYKRSLPSYQLQELSKFLWLLPSSCHRRSREGTYTYMSSKISPMSMQVKPFF